jgi:hypothetical protein
MTSNLHDRDNPIRESRFTSRCASGAVLRSREIRPAVRNTENEKEFAMNSGRDLWIPRARSEYCGKTPKIASAILDGQRPRGCSVSRVIKTRA